MKETTFTILSGATSSDTIDLMGRSIVGLRTPAMTGTALAIKEGNTTPLALGDESAALSITVDGTGRSIRLGAPVAACRYVQLVAGSSQGADRSITVITEDYAA